MSETIPAVVPAFIALATEVRAKAEDRAAEGGPVAALHALILATIAQLIARLGELIELWQQGLLPPPSQSRSRVRTQPNVAFATATSAQGAPTRAALPRPRPRPGRWNASPADAPASTNTSSGRPTPRTCPVSRGAIGWSRHLATRPRVIPQAPFPPSAARARGSPSDLLKSRFAGTAERRLICYDIVI